MHEIAKLSGHVWRPRNVITEAVQPTWQVPDLRTLPRETPEEREAFSRSPLARALTTAGRSGVSKLPQPGRPPIVGELLSNDSIRSQMAMLSDAVTQIRAELVRPVSFEATPRMAEYNQLAYDRLAALPQDALKDVLVAGRPEQATLFLQRIASEISDTARLTGRRDPAQLEEVFHSMQTPNGDAKVLGRTLINNEWYHFGTTSGTSPLQQASTWIAPTRLMTSSNPAALTELNAGRVLKDVQSLFEGPWKPYLKGAGLLEKPHTVDIRHADKDGIKSILATLEKVTKTLKTIQSVTKGIQDGLEFLGMMGSLGDLGKYMSIFNKMKLPGTPGELITALITGKGINPNKPPKPPVATQSGSGKNGVVVTKGGAAAAAIGDGLLAKAEAEKEKAEKEKAEKDARRKKEAQTTKNGPRNGTSDKGQNGAAETANSKNNPSGEKDTSERVATPERDNRTRLQEERAANIGRLLNGDLTDEERRQIAERNAQIDDELGYGKDEQDAAPEIPEHADGRNSHGGKHYSQDEVNKMLADIRDKNLVQSFFDHFGGGTYDFKINEPNATFDVNGTSMNAGEFGNFLAGYAGRVNGGDFGEAGVRIGGVLYDAADTAVYKLAEQLGYKPHLPPGSAPPEFDFDADSKPAIDAGVAQAEKDAPGPPPLPPGHIRHPLFPNLVVGPDGKAMSVEEAYYKNMA